MMMDPRFNILQLIQNGIVEDEIIPCHVACQTLGREFSAKFWFTDFAQRDKIQNLSREQQSPTQYRFSGLHLLKSEDVFPIEDSVCVERIQNRESAFQILSCKNKNGCLTGG